MAPRDRPTPRSSSSTGGSAGAAAALAVPPAVAATLPPTAAAATAAVGLLSAAQISQLAAKLAKSMLNFQSSAWDAAAVAALATLTSKYPDKPKAELQALLTPEQKFEKEFRRKMKERLDRDLPQALSITDPEEREAAVRAIMDREKRYSVQREEAMLARALGKMEARLLEGLSPQGAFWKLSPHVKQHTLDCLAMGNKFWPWSVLKRIQPPLHPGCPCYLLGLDEAIEMGLMTPELVPDPDDAEARYELLKRQVEDLEDRDDLDIEEGLAEIFGELELQEARGRHPLRWAAGHAKGGEFRPRRGGSPGALIRKVLGDGTPPVRGRERGDARWTWVGGTYTRVPEQRRWTARKRGSTYHSPPGSTVVYKDGKPVSAPGVPDLPREKRAPAVTPKVERNPRIEEVAEEIRAEARAARRRRGREIVRGDSSGDLLALMEEGYTLEHAEPKKGGTAMTLRAPEGEKVEVTYDDAQDQVTDVTWGGVPVSERTSVGARAPRDWHEFAADTLAWADELGQRFGADVKIPTVVINPDRPDHAGAHHFSGEAELGIEVRYDIDRAGKARENMRDLSDDELRGIWSAYWVAAHETAHAVNWIPFESFHGAGANLEEALTEEIAHQLAVERLTEQGQLDVVDWRARHPHALAVRGVYPEAREALARLFDRAGVVEPTAKRELLEELKFRTPPEERLDALAALIHEGYPAASLDEIRTEVQDAMETPVALGGVEPILDFEKSPGMEQVGHGEYGKLAAGTLSADGMTLGGLPDGSIRAIERLPLMDGYPELEGMTDGTAIVRYEAGQGRTGELTYRDGSPKSFRYIDTTERAKLILRALAGKGSPGVAYAADPAEVARVAKALDAGGLTYVRDEVPVKKRFDGGFGVGFSGRDGRNLSSIWGTENAAKLALYRADTGALLLGPPPESARRAPTNFRFPQPRDHGSTAGDDAPNLERSLTPRSFGEFNAAKAAQRERLKQSPGTGELRMKTFTDDELSTIEDALSELHDIDGSDSPALTKILNWSRSKEMKTSRVWVGGPGPRYMTTSTEVNGKTARENGTPLALNATDLGEISFALSEIDAPDPIRMRFQRAYEKLASLPKQSSGTELPDFYEDEGGNIIMGERPEEDWPADLLPPRLADLLLPQPPPKESPGVELGWLPWFDKGKKSKKGKKGKKGKGQQQIFDTKPKPPPKPVYIGGKEGVEADGPIPAYDGTRLKLGKGAGGSNGARWAFDDEGNRWLLKTYRGDADRIATELLANRVYATVGATVAPAGTIEVDGKTALTYKTLDGEVKDNIFKHGEPSEAVGRHFMTDALLANWDFSGMTDDNIMWDENGDPFRVDQGGTFEFKAMGGPKPYGPVPVEVWTMLQKGQAKRASKVTEDQMREQAAEIEQKLTGPVIDALVDAAPFKDEKMRERIRENMKARVAWMGAFSRGEVDLPRPLEDADARDAFVAAQDEFEVYPDERVAIERYVDEDGPGINDALKANAEWSKDEKKTIKALDGILRDAKTTEDMYLYLGVNLPVGELPPDMEGKTLEDKGFIHATTDHDAAAKSEGVIKVLVPEGTGALYLPDLLARDAESMEPQVILPRGSRLKLTGVKDGELTATLMPPKPPPFKKPKKTVYKGTNVGPSGFKPGGYIKPLAAEDPGWEPPASSSIWDDVDDGMGKQSPGVNYITWTKPPNVLVSTGDSGAEDLQGNRYKVYSNGTVYTVDEDGKQIAKIRPASGLGATAKRQAWNWLASRVANQAAAAGAKPVNGELPSVTIMHPDGGIANTGQIVATHEDGTIDVWPDEPWMDHLDSEQSTEVLSFNPSSSLVKIEPPKPKESPGTFVPELDYWKAIQAWNYAPADITKFVNAPGVTKVTLDRDPADVVEPDDEPWWSVTAHFADGGVYADSYEQDHDLARLNHDLRDAKADGMVIYPEPKESPGTAGAPSYIPTHDGEGAGVGDQVYSDAYGGATVVEVLPKMLVGPEVGHPRVKVKLEDDGPTIEAPTVDEDGYVWQLTEADASEGKHTTIMVALFPPPETAAALALKNGCSPEELHVTLAFCGDVAGKSKEKALNAVARWAKKTGPLAGKVSGIGHFEGGPDPVTYASLDLPTLTDARPELVKALDKAGIPPSRDHGFTPHLTLDYAKRMPKLELPMDVTFDRVTLAWAEERTSFPLDCGCDD